MALAPRCSYDEMRIALVAAQLATLDATPPAAYGR